MPDLLSPVVGDDKNGPRFAAAGAGQGDEDLTDNDPRVLDVVPVGVHARIARDGAWSGLLIM